MILQKLNCHIIQDLSSKINFLASTSFWYVCDIILYWTETQKQASSSVMKNNSLFFFVFFSLTSSAHIWKQIKPRILETLAVCLTELWVSDFYWVFFLWYSSFVINFPRFFEVAFQADDLRHSQNNYQIRLYKLNSMCEELSYQIINTSAVNQTVFCYYQKFAKIIIKKKTLVLAVASNTGMHFFGFI